MALTVVDARGRVLSANREARRLSGRAPRAGESCREYWGCLLCPSRCPLKRALGRRRTVYHALVRSRGPRGTRAMVERIAPLGRGAAIVSGPATAFLRRLRRLKRNAGTDALTGVLTRGRFEELIARGPQRERRKRPDAFVMMDVDGLKAINDRLGHAAGDRVLHRLGAVLQQNIRRSDIAGRLGGDEFALYSPGATRARALGLLRRLRRAIDSSNAAHAREPRLSVQFGLACGRAGDGGRLRARADALLYRRKQEHSLRRSAGGSEKER